MGFMKTLKASLIASAIGTGAWLLGLAHMMWPDHPQGAVFIITIAATFLLMYVWPDPRR
jgi:ABC-type Mn2+/Zn2+ transport system permease subunit